MADLDAPGSTTIARPSTSTIARRPGNRIAQVRRGAVASDSEDREWFSQMGNG
jgi:hypothetical protein